VVVVVVVVVVAAAAAAVVVLVLVVVVAAVLLVQVVIPLSLPPPSSSLLPAALTLTLSPGEWGDTQVVEILLSYGADVNAKDYYRRTPLYLASTEDGMENDIVKMLLAKGAH